MSVEVRQSVREQPDTGYGKRLPAYFLTAPGCGGGRIDGDWNFLMDSFSFGFIGGFLCKKLFCVKYVKVVFAFI